MKNRKKKELGAKKIKVAKETIRDVYGIFYFEDGKWWPIKASPNMFATEPGRVPNRRQVDNLAFYEFGIAAKIAQYFRSSFGFEYHKFQLKKHQPA